MRNFVYIITTVALVLFIQSCYTIIKRTNVEHNYNGNSQFPENSGLNSRLTGDWINKKLWADYGHQIRKLEIKDNGSVIYIPDFERNNSKIYYGSYRILSDTLIIKFDWEDRAEWMNYDLNDNTLAIKNLKGREGTESNLVNDCYDCITSWQKVQ